MRQHESYKVRLICKACAVSLYYNPCIYYLLQHTICIIIYIWPRLQKKTARKCPAKTRTCDLRIAYNKTVSPYDTCALANWHDLPAASVGKAGWLSVQSGVCKLKRSRLSSKTRPTRQFRLKINQGYVEQACVGISNYQVGMARVLYQEQSRYDGHIAYCTQISIATVHCILIEASGAGVPIGLIQYTKYLLLATVPLPFV
jgi:hypothetical protein